MCSTVDCKGGAKPRQTGEKMKLDPQTRDILRQYKNLINARRRENGQRELRTEQVIDEICYYMTCQCSVYIGGHFILQGGKGH